VDALRQRQLELIRSATAASLNDGRYDDITRAYYEAFAKSVSGSPYERLAIFYRERDRRIAENVSRIIKEHAGKRVAVIMGADHRAHTIETLRDLLGPKITLVAVP
jgi:nitrogenase molybdenum-iron protein alpha/beta subunit